jgi:hypothetical protein
MNNNPPSTQSLRKRQHGEKVPLQPHSQGRVPTGKKHPNLIMNTLIIKSFHNPPCNTAPTFSKCSGQGYK